MELPFIFVATVMIGGGLGYLLDDWLNTSPVFLLVLGALGFVGAILDLLRRLSQEEKRDAGK